MLFSLMLGVSNMIWLTLMLSAMAEEKRLTILATNFLGLSFLILYTLVHYFACTQSWNLNPLDISDSVQARIQSQNELVVLG